MTNSIAFIRALAGLIEEETEVYTISDFDLSTINGEKNEALILHIANITEAIPANNTQKLSIIASIVILPETLDAAEEAELQNSVYTKISTFLSDENLRYKEIADAVFLQYLPGQYTISVDGLKTNYDLSFEIIAQF